MLRTWPQEPRQQKNPDAVEAVPGCVTQPVLVDVAGAAAVPGAAGVLVLTSVAIHVLLDAKDAPGVLPDALDVMITVQPPVEHRADQDAVLFAEKDALQDAMEDARQHALQNAVEHAQEDVGEDAYPAAQDVEQDVIQAVEAPVHAVLDVQAAQAVDLVVQPDVKAAILHATDVMDAGGVTQVAARIVIHHAELTAHRVLRGVLAALDALLAVLEDVQDAVPDAQIPAQGAVPHVPEGAPGVEDALRPALRTAHQTAAPHAEASAMALHRRQ